MTGTSTCRNVAAVLAVLVLWSGVHHVAIAATAGAPPGEGVADVVTPEDRLRRNKVEPARGIGNSEFRRQQSRALKGDRQAALLVAKMFQNGSNGAPRDEDRMVQWLLHASSLNNGTASYELYQHYLKKKLDRDAVFFENRAREQGFVPPARVDPRRG